MTRLEERLNNREKDAWLTFNAVVNNSLRNKKSDNYVEILKYSARKYNIFGCNMNLKLHMDLFPDNLGAVSEEKGERLPGLF